MSQPLLRVVSNEEIDRQQALDIDFEQDLQKQQGTFEAEQGLAAHIKKQYNHFKWHRTEHNLHRRYLNNLRQYNGEYTPTKYAEIKKFGGSDVFARITTSKCRGASALLRDVYLSSRDPWVLEPTPVPELPEDVGDNIEQLVAAEALSLISAGQQVDPAMLQQRQDQLMASAAIAAKKQAYNEAKEAQARLNDLLTEGGFYTALNEFLVDLPIFPFACIKGPIVKNKRQLDWSNGKLRTTYKPTLCWERVSGFDLYFTPGASSIEDSDVIERIKVSRADLNALLGLPGYNDDAIRAVLRDYAHGLQDWLDEAESERAHEENKENPYVNRSNLIDTLEYHGNVKGEWLLDYGFREDQVPDPDREYHVVAWLIGRHVIKVQLNPNPMARPPYYITSFEKIPGSIYGNALPETLADVQDVANAALRQLVNNMAFSSGPQVVVNEDRLSPLTDADSMYPWKRWRTVADPLGADNRTPIEFFQPSSNAQELLGVYEKMMDIADEVSAIPRYITGSEKVGGAASTASGLSMLMNNASKVFQSVAACIDREVLEPLLEDLYNMVMLTDGGKMLRGDEKIVVRGATVAMQKEQDRMRRLEFLQMTANPIDMQIVGMKGRAAVLESISEDLGLPYEQIVPDQETMQQRLEAEAGLANNQDAAAAQAQGAQTGVADRGTQGAGRAGEETDNAFRTNA